MSTDDHSEGPPGGAAGDGAASEPAGGAEGQGGAAAQAAAVGLSVHPDATDKLGGPPDVSGPQPIVRLDREPLSADELHEAWTVLDAEERLEGFQLLDRSDSEDFFLTLSASDQSQIMLALSPNRRRFWMRLLAPDDAADVVQEGPTSEREALLGLLEQPARGEVQALLAYAEDDAGGLMSPRFARVRPDQTVDEAVRYLRKQARERLETVYYVYVLDAQQHLLGVISFRELFGSPEKAKVREVMHTDVVTVRDDMDQEAVSRVFAKHDLMAIPVVDADGRMRGIVTVDDIVDVIREEATEDIQKMGGIQPLDDPYLQVGFMGMVKKRAPWLVVLFFGELLTANAIGFFEKELAKAVMLALFIPLIISSGGNSGSQATTLVIRAMALGELKLRDWFLVVRRELGTGLALGAILGTLAVVRVSLFSKKFGPHWAKVAIVMGTTLVGVVTFGTFVGSMLPFILRRLGLDPASASAPFVATLADVTGLLIYFSVASMVLRGSLL